MKMKENKQKINTWTLPENEKKKQQLWNMLMTVAPVEVGVLGTVHKGLERILEELEIRI